MTLAVSGRSLAIDSTWVMGVVNASPESFSDAGRFDSLDAQRAHASALVAQGAHIIDVGGQSAITSQPELDSEIETQRVVPLVEWLRAEFPEVLISVDTYKPAVVASCLEAGAHIINDVSGLLYPEIAGMCARHSAALVVMHTAAPPKVRLQRRDLYADVTREVVDFLATRIDLAIAAGLSREAIIVDPGPDFTKTPHQTVEVLRGIAQVRALGRPVLLALSRKDFLGAITGRTPAHREAATAAAIAYFASAGGSIVRVHDVAAAVDVITTVETLAGRREIDPGYLLPDSLRHEPRL